jgi:hypothetical protein
VKKVTKSQEDENENLCPPFSIDYLLAWDDSAVFTPSPLPRPAAA